MRQSRELQAAVKAAKEAGRVLLRYYGNSYGIKNKGARQGIVTDADFAADRVIQGILKKEFPLVPVVSEEDEKQKAASKDMWIVDPLDGTLNFVRGIDFFAVEIAFLKDGALSAGVVFNPVSKDLFAAEKGRGAFLNGKKIRVSNVSNAKECLFDIGLPRREGVWEKGFELMQKLYPDIGSIRNYGSAALQLSFVANGKIDCFLEYGLYPWDVAAGIILIEEAGGKVTNEKGAPFDMFKDNIIVASNGTIHDTLIRRLSAP